MNDKQALAKIVLDSAIASALLVNVHPLHNEATLAMTPADLVRFMEGCGHKPVFMSF